ncbi:MAG: hypothetical protein R3B99_29080 [Polyangiales bacterium]
MTVVFEGVSFDVDAEAIDEAAARLPPWVHGERGARALGGFALDEALAEIPATTGELAEEAFEIDDGRGGVNFVQAIVLAEVLAAELGTFVHEGALRVATEDAPLAIVHGSLTVEGDLTLHTGLLVLGDLRVKGRLRDLEPYSRLIVTGDLHATTLWSRSPVWVAGRVESKVVHLDRHGQVFAGEVLRAELVIESAESRGVDGAVEARFHSPAERWQSAPRDALAELRARLVPEAYAEDTRHPFFDPEPLLARAEAGGRLLAEA